MADDIVITGLGIVSPIGGNESDFWNACLTGQSGAAPIDCLDTSELTRKVGCQVRAPLGFSPDAPPAGRATQLAVVAARQAVADAALDPAAVPNDRIAIAMGTTMGETEFIEDSLGAAPEQWLSQDHMRRIASGRPGSIARGVASDIAACGPALDLYGACAAGNMAITTARRELLDGRCDVALAGGSDGFSRLAFIGFMRLRVMAAEVCRPFDEERDGLLVGEGSAVFVLERESHARARGARIRARVTGSALTCENYHPTRPDPDGDGLSRAIRSALAEAGLAPGEIDYVCAHGTGTPQNDAIEVRVMQHCFPNGVRFSSVKALTGHTMGAAAAVEAACCVLSLERQTLIPTWNLRKPQDLGGLEALQGGPAPARVRHVINNSAGFGGYNSSIVLTAA